MPIFSLRKDLRPEKKHARERKRKVVRYIFVDLRAEIIAHRETRYRVQRGSSTAEGQEKWISKRPIIGSVDRRVLRYNIKAYV